jgi:hypothetical protein
MPYTIDQGRTFLIDILALIVVAPLLTGLVIVLFRQSDRRRVAGSAGVAAGVSALGLIMYGTINQLQNRPLFLTDQDILLSNGASAIGNVGLALATAALIMGIVESVRIRRWGVFTGFLLLMVAAELFVYLFNVALFVLPFLHVSNPLVNRLLARDPAVAVPYFFFSSFLLFSVPVAALLLAFFGLKRASHEPSNEGA